jgi:DNA-binding response OmpR family regulator
MTDSALTVVVADDDADIRALVAISVSKAGLEIVAAVSDGQLAIDAVRHYRPDIAILDVTMPLLTGLEVTVAIRAEPDIAGTRVLLLSAGVGEIANAAGLEAGADDFLGKPFSPKQLTAHLLAFANGGVE